MLYEVITVAPPMVEKLQCHVAESADANDADTVGRANCILNKRVESYNFV